MKIRLVKEPRENGQFLYSTEKQEPNGTWIYVTQTCSRDLVDATARFERVLTGNTGPIVLREGETNV